MNHELFDWDDANIVHIAGHGVTPEETEEALSNRPLDVKTELRHGEQRVAHIGETNEGRVLVVISTMSGSRIRVVTAWSAKKNYRQYSFP